MNREEKARKVRSAIIKTVKSEGTLSVNEIRIIISLERIVARLSNDSKLDKHLVYKGGFVLLKTLGSNRFTRDLDALGLDLDKEKIALLVPVALALDLDDGFWFGDVKVESLDEQGEYGALRFNCAYQIGDPPAKNEAIKKLSRIHFDVGFGDAIPTDLKRTTMQSLLTFDSKILWRVYPPEFIFSEKLQTLVNRESGNSRSKDVHDMCLLFEQCDLNKLLKAISNTFTCRGTKMPESFLAFAETLDIRMLESGWRSVKLSKEEKSFSEYWGYLKTHLAKIDIVLAKKKH